MSKKYRLMCEFCGWNRIIGSEKEVEDLNQIITSPIPKGAKYPDKKTDLKPIKQIKKFKCLKCGRLVIPKPFKDTQAELDEKLSQQKKKENNEKDNVVRCESGTQRPEVPGLDSSRIERRGCESPVKPFMCVQPALLPEVIEQALRPPIS